MLNRKCNSKRPLVFANVVFTNTMGACKAREIQARIDHLLVGRYNGMCTGLVEDALAEGKDQGRVKRSVKEEEVRLACIFHSTVP